MRMSKSTALGMGVILFGCVAAHAQGPVSFEVTADYVGKYIWRGQNLNDDPAFQPGASAAIGNLTLGVWGSMDTTDFAGESGHFTEVDYLVDYSDSVGGMENLGYSIGYIGYDFPELGTETIELYAGLTWDTVLSPSVTLYYDIEDVEGYYLSLGAAHTIENVLGDVGADISASLGYGDSRYNKVYWGVSSAELNDFAIGVGFPFEVGEVSVTPSVTYIALLDSDIKANSTDNSYVVLGIGAALAF